MFKLVKNMIVVIIGMGCIGVVIVKIYVGFGVIIIVYDVYFNKDLDFLIYKDSVKEVIKDVDIIFLYVLVNKESYYLFDKVMFDYVKKGVILVNVVCGVVINIFDLIVVVNDGILLGVVIDIYENEVVYFINDWINKDIDDKILLELIEYERILVILYIVFFFDEVV